jgi:large conductance mechanosensitive channel
MRGNLIDLAVAVVIGTAFTAMVTAIVSDIITPLIAAIGGKPNFGNLTFTVHHSEFKYGLLINAIVSFLIVAAVVYFLIVAPMARVTSRFTRHKEATERDCPECLSSIPVAATRCKYCTAQVAPAVLLARGDDPPDPRCAPCKERSLGSGRGLAVPSPDACGVQRTSSAPHKSCTGS